MRLTHLAAALVVALSAAAASGFQVTTQPVDMPTEPQRLDVYRQANGDLILQHTHPDRPPGKAPPSKPAPKGEGTPSTVRIFIPANVKTINGILFDIGYNYTPDDTALQAVAREKGWAIVGCLLRYAGGTQLLDRSLKQFAEKSGHPELVRAPIFPFGFSRNGARAWDFLEENPDRTLCLLLGGNPGNPAGLGKAAYPGARNRTEWAREIPTLTIVGSKDPFVDYNKEEFRYWHNAHYPTIRQHEGVTWGMMIGWGYGHGPEGSWVVFVPFIEDCFRLRDTGPHAPNGQAKFKNIAFNDGWLAEYGWKTDWPEIAPVKDFKADKTKAIWLPAANTAHVWRAFQVKSPRVTLAVTGTPASLTLTAEAPAGTTQVEFFDRAEPLGMANKAPFTLTTSKLAAGVSTVFAVATVEGAKTPSRPVTLAVGKPVDWQKGAAASGEAGKAPNAVRLSPELRAVLKAALDPTAAQKPTAAQLDALKKALEEGLKDDFAEQRQTCKKLLGQLPK